MVSKLVKEAAELYALGAISIDQLAEGLTYAELQDALIYSEYYGGKYNKNVRDQEEIEAHDIIDSIFADNIDDRCMYNIWQYGLTGEFELMHDSPFEFCLEWDIVPEDILDRYIKDCCITY